MDATDNEILTRTGRGAALGDRMRQYWVPALLPEELPFPGCPPVAVKLLGERLIAFRAENGDYGLLQEFCAHRRASLFFGRCEDDGLRCAYHGWKYDNTGQCIDMPSEPPTSNFKNEIKIQAYRLVEHGGALWAYLGAGDPPGLPEFEWTQLPEGHRYLSKRLQHCNYLQALEGGIDASHVSSLHSDSAMWSYRDRKRSVAKEHFSDSSPRFYIQLTDYGLMVAAERRISETERYCRVTQLILPWYSILAPFEGGMIGSHAFVPADDDNCHVWSIDYRPSYPLTRSEIESFRAGGGIHAEMVPGTEIPVRNQSNNYLMNRAFQRAGSMTGIEGIAAQDMAMQESMGPIVDRTAENLGSSDSAIVMLRKRLLSLAKSPLGDVPPPGAEPRTQRVRSAGLYLRGSEKWSEVAGDHIRVDTGDAAADVQAISTSV